MNNISFQNIPKQFQNLKDDITDPVIKKLYSKFTFFYISCDLLYHLKENIKEIQDQLYKFLLDYLAKYKFITYDLADTSKFNDFSLSTSKFTIICIENECLIIENIEIQLMNQILKETKSYILDITPKSDENLAKEEISSFCSHFIQSIKINSFVKLTINSIIGYSIRKYFCPSNFFIDQSFFRFEQEEESESFDHILSEKLIEIFESKNEIETRNKIQELKSKIRQINDVDYQPQIYEFKQNDFIILRTIEINETFVFNLVIHIETLYIFLLKKIIYFKDKNKINHEINFCKNYKHRCFTRFYGFLKENEKIIGFVYEFMTNGSLSKYIKKQSKKETDVIYSILTIMRIFEGIEYIHSNSLVHRDLKPLNILLDHNSVPYISDFETIRKLEENQTKEDLTFDFVSLFYSSPEQYNNELISYSTDIFSFGLIVYFLFEKKDMIQFEDENLIFESIKNGKIPKISNVSANIQKLYVDNVNYDKEKRLSLKENKKLIINEILTQSSIENYLIEDFKIIKNFAEIQQYFIEIFHLIKNEFESFDKFFDNFIELFPILKNEDKSNIILNLGNSYFLGKDVEQDYSKAKKYYEISAKLNNSVALNNLAIMLIKGFGVEKNYIEAKKNLEKASKLNNSTAIFNLGHLYFVDDTQSSKAIEYFELSANLGNSNALFFLGYLYFEGLSFFKQDIMKSIKYLNKVQNDIPISSFILGYIYLSGDSIEEDYLKAIELFDLYNEKKSEVISDPYVIKEGNITNNFFNNKKFYNSLIKTLDSEHFLLLGTRYLLGEGIIQNDSKAKYYFEIAAEQQNLDACFLLGYLYFIGKGCKKDYKKARKYFEISFIKYKNDVLIFMGIIYLYGFDVEIDYSKAKNFFELAAKNNNSDGFLNIGILYLKGQGVEKDYAKAKNYFEISANLKNEIAYYNLGFLYENGIGVTVDLMKAKYYYELSAEKNISSALINLGNLYLAGRLGENNFQKAKECFELAAKQKNQTALINLGYIYENGLGVTVDYLKAKHYYELVINQDDSEIESKIQNLNNIDKKIDFFKTLNQNELLFWKNKSLAYLNLAELYLTGKYFKIDYPKAIKYLELSAKFENSLALLKLGDIFYSGNGVKKNYFKSLFYYEKSARFANQIAMNKLGVIYLEGKIIKQNYLKAKYYFESAISLNNSESFYYLGIMYSTGEFFDVDIEKSIVYFENCIKTNKEYTLIKDFSFNISMNIIRQNRNYYPSYNELGFIYLTHFNDKELSYKYFKEAAFAEFPFGQNNYGLLFQYFYNNIENARYMYQRSSEHNFSMAEFNLGKLYEDEGDIEKSIHYFVRASEHEFEPLKFQRNIIDDSRLFISKKFILCLTNLKLVIYFYSQEKIKSNYINTKKYFKKAISNLMNQKEYPFIFKIDDNVFDYSYLKLYILNYPLFNLSIKLAEKSKFIIKTKMLSTMKSKNKQLKKQNNVKIKNQNDFIPFFETNKNLDEIFFEDPDSLFDFVFKNNKRIESFMKTIDETVEIMKSILYSPPFVILFGRICIFQDKPKEAIQHENINHHFYDGFGINQFS